jgi:hypothetical protein
MRRRRRPYQDWHREPEPLQVRVERWVNRAIVVFLVFAFGYFALQVIVAIAAGRF